jgi:hypothetical protein
MDDVNFLTQSAVITLTTLAWRVAGALACGSSVAG